MRAATLIEYVLLISVVSLVICLAGPPVADAINKQFGHVENVVANGTTGSGGGGGSDFPGGGSGGDNQDKTDTDGDGIPDAEDPYPNDPDKPGQGGGGQGGGDGGQDPEPEKKRLEGTLELSALYVGKTGTVAASGVSAGAQLSYRWTADGQALDGASGAAWTPGAEHAGKNVSVSAVDAGGKYAGSITSPSVTVKRLDMAGTVSLSAAVAGKPVTATVDGAPAGAVPGYKWAVDGQVVSEGRTWTPGVEHVGKTVTVTVTDTTGVYAGSIGADAVVGQQELTGSIVVTPGEAGTESVATVDGAPSDADIELTWNVDGTAIGAGAAVALPEDSEGKTLTVEGRDKSGIYRGIISASLVIKADPRVAEAFAVYSADDQSLDFYKRKSVSKAGEVFEGKTATEVYTGIETTHYGMNSLPPWSDKASTLLTINVRDKIKPISLAGWFAGCSTITELNLSNIDTSRTENMEALFFMCSSLKELDLSGFQTGSVTNMNNMFSYCKAIYTLDLSGFDTHSVTNMWSMFDCCTNLTSINLSSFDTSAVTNMGGMFSSCTNLSAIDLSNFNTQSVEEINKMFANCSNLTSLDLSNFVTSKVTTMASIFSGCESLATLDLSSFNTASVVEADSIFTRCYKLAKVRLGEGFAWKDSWHAYLPTPTASAIPGADGNWYNSKGVAFTPANIPSNVADTYYASKDMLPQMIGSAAISGEAVVGGTLTASISGQPSDAAVGWQWKVDGVPVESATGTTYSPVDADAGKTVTVAARDAGGKYFGEIESAGVVVTKPVAFAIVDLGAGEMYFYKRAEVPNPGETYDGHSVSSVFTGVEDSDWMFHQVPWRDGYSELHIRSVEFVDVIKPVSIANWFYDMPGLNRIDLTNLDTSRTTNMAYAFMSNNYVTVTIGKDFSWVGTDCYLVKPSGGYWYNTKGEKFRPEEIPSNVADTYTLTDPRPAMTGSVEISDPVAGRDCKATVSGAPSDAVLSYTWYKSSSPDDVGWTEVAGAYGDTLPGSKVIASEFRSKIADAKIVSPIGSKMYYKVAVSDASGKYAGSIESAPKVATEPVPLSGKVTVTGTPTYGGMLTANVSGVPSDAVLAYQWKRDGVDIDGATGQMRSVSNADQGCDLVVAVSDASGKYAGVIESAAVPAFRNVSWASGSDSDVARMVEAADAGYIKLTDYWKSGDTRSVQLSAMDASNGLDDTHAAQTVEFVLSDSGHYTLSNGKACNFVVIQKDCLNEAGRMNTSATNIGGWKDSARRAWCNSTYLNALPNAIKPIFKPFKVSAAIGSGTASMKVVDTFSLFSEKEIYGSTSNANATVEYENSQLDYYKTTSNRTKGINGVVNGWWERSVFYNSTNLFCAVSLTSTAGSTSAYNYCGIAPFGCI